MLNKLVSNTAPPLFQLPITIRHIITYMSFCFDFATGHVKRYYQFLSCSPLKHAHWYFHAKVLYILRDDIAIYGRLTLAFLRIFDN